VGVSWDNNLENERSGLATLNLFIEKSSLKYHFLFHRLILKWHAFTAIIIKGLAFLRAKTLKVHQFP
jgi:hypothetical protein